MNLYLITRGEGMETSWDEYCAAVVAAPSASAARKIHPSDEWPSLSDRESWIEPRDVKVTYLGKAAKTVKTGIICADYLHG